MKLTPLTDCVSLAEGATVTTIYRMGQECVLIDSGHPRDGDDLLRLLEEENLTVRGILSTHCHHDHFGNCRRIAAKYHLPVILPLGEAAACRSTEAMAAVFDHPAVTPLRSGPLSTIPGPVDETIGFEQDSITVAGVSFDIIHTPGHTADNVCFRTPDGVLVVGDVLITPDVLAPLRAPYTTNVAQDLLSKKQILQTPCTYCVMAHRGFVPAKELPAVAQANFTAFAEMIAAVRSVITKPMPLEEIIPRFCRVRGINGSNVTRGVQMHHIVSGVVGYLVDAGELTTETALGVTSYVPVNRRESAQAHPSGEHSASGGRAVTAPKNDSTSPLAR